MSDTGSVINFKTRKTLEETEAQTAADEIAKAEAEAKYAEFQKVCASETQVEMLKTLDMVRQLVEAGKLDSFMIVGQSSLNGYFLDHMVLNRDKAGPITFHSYGGKLTELAMNFADMASCGPSMLIDGTLFTIQPALDDEDEED